MNLRKILYNVIIILSFINLSIAEDIKQNTEYKKEIEKNISNGNDNSIKKINFQQKRMTFEEILEFTFNNNDILNAERSKTKAVETFKLKVIGQNALPNIGIELNYGYTDFKQSLGAEPMRFKFNDDGLLENNKIYLQQPIFKSGRTITQIKAVNQQILMQKNQLNQKEQEILFNAIQAILNIIQSTQILNITIKNEESLKNSYDYIKAKKQVGRATTSDLSLAEARYSSARSDTILATTNYLNAKSNFLKITKIDSNYIDIDYDFIFKIAFSYNIEFDKVLEMSLNKNPQYHMAKNNYEINRNNLNYTRTSFLPELYLNAQWGRQKTTDISLERAGSVSLNLKVPLFQGGTEYASNREASHLLNESKFTLNDVKDSLIQQNINTYDEFLSSKSLIVSSKAYRDAAKLALDSTVAEERVGKSTIVDILNRRKEYFDTEVSFLKNKTNVMLIYYKLRLLMGELNLFDLFIF